MPTYSHISTHICVCGYQDITGSVILRLSTQLGQDSPLQCHALTIPCRLQNCGHFSLCGLLEFFIKQAMISVLAPEIHGLEWGRWCKLSSLKIKFSRALHLPGFHFFTVEISKLQLLINNLSQIHITKSFPSL